MGNSTSSVVGSAFLQSLSFLGGPGTGGLSAINSLDQTTTPTTEPAVVPTSWVNDGPPPSNFTPLTAPQFYNNETSGPYAYLGQRYYNKVVNNNPNNATNSNNSNYLEYILLIGGAVLIVVIIAKKDNSE